MSNILIEVQPSRAPGDLAPRPAVPEEFRARADEIAESIASVAATLQSKLEQLAQKGAEAHRWNLTDVEVNFQLTVQAEVGIMITKATTGGIFGVKLLWKAALGGK